jgi:hypothetical protein
MLDALKSLFESNVISEETRVDIETAWNRKIQENREIVTQQLREEFAQKYEHDKQVMVEAIDQMITDRLSAEIQEFTEDRAQLAEAKAKYAVAIREHSHKLNGFIAESLAKEIHELHEDQKIVADNFAKLEGFIIEALAKEIADFYNDKKDLAETKVRLVKEAKVQFSELKGKFIKHSAELVESVVKQGLTQELKHLKEDIDTARQNDFGRKIFEAFTSEYQLSLLNEKSETSKLLKVVAAKDKALAEAKAVIGQKQALVESTQREVARAKEIAARKEIMSELLTPLASGQREIMSELLESVQTSKLRGSYDKYLPSVLKGSTIERKQPLVEAKEITGNKQSNSISSAKSQGEVIEISRLAGIIKK